MGRKKKEEVDASYPVYMNHGAILQLMDGSAVLYDEDYEKEATYQGLFIEGGYAYNMDGEKADHCKYLFLGMNNGNFINFEEITYKVKNEQFDINENSLIHFESDYFSYYEYENGELIYKYCISVNDSFKINVGENQYTYDELPQNFITKKEATMYGLPIQVYFFSRNKVWKEYECIQSDIFDHLLAMVPKFDLKLYQYSE